MNYKRGYTLVEMLAAIAVIGLTLGGLTEGGRVIAAYQKRGGDLVANLADTDQFARAVQDLATRSSAADLSGDATRFQSKCGSEACSIALGPTAKSKSEAVISTGSQRRIYLLPGGASFRYQTTEGLRDRWPSDDPYEHLHGIAIITRSGAPVAYAQTQDIEPFGCEYDVIAMACRARVSP